MKILDSEIDYFCNENIFFIYLGDPGHIIRVLVKSNDTSAPSNEHPSTNKCLLYRVENQIKAQALIQSTTVNIDLF